MVMPGTSVARTPGWSVIRGLGVAVARNDAFATGEATSG
jgi:hypothetical protein